MPAFYLAVNMGYRKLAIAENKIMRKSVSQQLPMPDSGDAMDWK
jgi:hypothetical protein